MRLPGADRPVVNADKIREYLLSAAHPVGRFKAAFFGGLGYSAAEWDVLAADLRGHAVENEASATEANEYGQKYEVRGRMLGPAGKTAFIVAVWIAQRRWEARGGLADDITTIAHGTEQITLDDIDDVTGGDSRFGAGA